MVRDTLGRGRAYVADHVEGGFQVLLVGVATVGGQEGHCGGEVRTSVSGESGEAANQKLVGFPALDEEVVVFIICCGWNAVDGTARPVGRCKRVEVDVLKAMALHGVLSVGFLGEETREGAVLVGRPLKVGTEEPVDCAHKINLDSGHE